MKAVSTQRYVVGFVFSANLRHVWLIHKRRPSWQAGLLNGIGGKIEQHEEPADAMRREFQEEAGLDITDWSHFATLSGESFEVHFFRSQLPFAPDDEPRTMTDEHVEDFDVRNIIAGAENTVSNLRWLLPMAMPSSAHDWPYAIRERAPPKPPTE